MYYTSKKFNYFTWNIEKILIGHCGYFNKSIFVNFVKFHTMKSATEFVMKRALELGFIKHHAEGCAVICNIISRYQKVVLNEAIGTESDGL